MAMNLGTADDGDDAPMNSTINTTPLVDVMLVLLIIFLITIPVVTQTIRGLELPKEENVPTQTKPENIVIHVDREGDVYWGMERLADIEALVNRLKVVAVKPIQPEVHIRGDLESVGRVVVACQRAGILKVGFITEPPPKGGSR
jgi:biopolymer transport protein ExbD